MYVLHIMSCTHIYISIYVLHHMLHINIYIYTQYYNITIMMCIYIYVYILCIILGDPQHKSCYYRAATSLRSAQLPLERPSAALPELAALESPGNSVALNITWTPSKVCALVALLALFEAFGTLFNILLGSRQAPSQALDSGAKAATTACC